MATLTEEEMLQELLDRDNAHENLMDFTRYRMPHFETADHHQKIAAALQRVERGEINRLIINMPPRHTKSELASRSFPAWYMGRHPTKQIITCSYGTQTANDFGRDVRNIIAAPEFRSVFPEVNLRQDSRAVGRWHTNRGGIYIAASVHGALTGRGAHLGVIDDPHKDYKEGNDKRRTDALWDWYGSTFYTRLMPGAAIIIIMQRMSDHDLTARILEKAKQTGEYWEVVSLPAIDTKGGKVPLEQGEALWPAWYPLARLLAIRSAQEDPLMSTARFDAMYQQQPRPPEGMIIKKDWTNTFWYDPHRPETFRQGRIILPTHFDEEIQSWDLAFKDNPEGSWVVGQRWGFKKAQSFWLDQRRGHWGFNDTEKQIILASAEWKSAHRKLVEDKANGPAIINRLSNRLGGIKAWPCVDSKPARAEATTPMWEAKNVVLPPPEAYPWIRPAIDTLHVYPGEPNDEGDAAFQALNYRQSKRNLLDLLTTE